MYACIYDQEMARTFQIAMSCHIFIIFLALHSFSRACKYVRTYFRHLSHLDYLFFGIPSTHITFFPGIRFSKYVAVYCTTSQMVSHNYIRMTHSLTHSLTLSLSRSLISLTSNMEEEWSAMLIRQMKRVNWVSEAVELKLWAMQVQYQRH